MILSQTQRIVLIDIIVNQMINHIFNNYKFTNNDNSTIEFIYKSDNNTYTVLFSDGKYKTIPAENINAEIIQLSDDALANYLGIKETDEWMLRSTLE